TGAFIGIAEKGALGTPKLVTNWSQFVKDFGGHRRDSFLAHAVQGFFLNGGSRCFVVRVASSTAAIASATLQDRAGAPLDTLGVQALNEGEWGNRLTVDVADGTKTPATEFMLVVKQDGETVETWDDLSLDSEAENYVEAVVNDGSAFIRVTDLASATAAPDNRPAVQTDVPLTGGADGASDIADADYVGSEADRTGLHSFDIVDEINNLCVPGVSTQTVVQAALDYVDDRGDCGVIVDSPEGGDPASTKAFREGFDSSRGYYYFPRIKALDPLTKRVAVVPPSGHIAGLFARSDGERGVHKAPSNEVLRGAVGLEYEVTDGEQEVLNPAGVNCIRAFRGRGIRVWGARTMSSDPSLTHIHKRRFLMFVEESIAESTQWIVHEPNDQRLWGKIIRSVSAFLRRQWLEGALFGASEAEAYYVKCDEETNPPEVRAAFQVITEVGVNVVETAEFVVFRVAQWSGGRRVTE
ncbi:MAG: phage tail sheath family protein, partial [Planctomycetota bacterium]